VDNGKGEDMEELKSLVAPTREELEIARKVDLYYHTCDAQQHVESYLMSATGLTDEQKKRLTSEDTYKELAELFESRRESCYADDDVWENVIQEYADYDEEDL
jgi:hypothetical protein